MARPASPSSSSSPPPSRSQQLGQRQESPAPPLVIQGGGNSQALPPRDASPGPVWLEEPHLPSPPPFLWDPHGDSVTGPVLGEARQLERSRVRAEWQRLRRRRLRLARTLQSLQRQVYLEVRRLRAISRTLLVQEEAVVLEANDSFNLLLAPEQLWEGRDFYEELNDQLDRVEIAVGRPDIDDSE